MSDLLAALARGDVLGASTTTLLFDVMERCETGQNRIKALLPEGTRVAHKTGAFANPLDPETGVPLVTNDVGLVQLPSHRGRVAMAILVANSPWSRPRQERVIARLARRIYDHFATGE